MKKGKEIGKKSIIILTVFIILFSMFGNYNVLGDDERGFTAKDAGPNIKGKYTLMMMMMMMVYQLFRLSEVCKR